MSNELVNTSHLKADERIIILEKELLIVQSQLGRIVSDIESEKGTRKRINQEVVDMVGALDKRVRLLEKSIWAAFGILTALQFLLKL